MELTTRQKEIIQIVREHEPISGDNIAKKLQLTRPTLRNDLSILTMTGILDARPKVGYFFSGQPFEPLLFEKLYEPKITEIMLPAVFIKQTDTVQNAVTNLFMYDVGSLYVINEEEEFVGILSRKDLLRATVNSANASAPVAMIMTRKPNLITVTADTRILDAGYMLMSHAIDTLPVIDQPSSASKVIGKITKTALMSYFIKEGLRIEKEK